MRMFCLLLMLALWPVSTTLAASTPQETAGAHDDAHSEDDVVALSEAQQRTLGLTTIELQRQPQRVRHLTVPAELVNNEYRTWSVPVRIDSLVRERRVTLGQHVKKGDPIALLFSPAMAELHSSLRIAADAWQRVAALGRRTVGNERYLSARGRYQALRAQALGYGLSEADVKAVIAGDGEPGRYILRAPDDGLVLSDHFQQGEWLVAGRSLVTLVDESLLWAEAALPPRPGLSVPEGTPARIAVGDRAVDGAVIQAGHRLDPVTRTLRVRVAVPNQQHLFHPGMFASVTLSLPLADDWLAVPESALTRGPDGDWQLFTELAPGHYRPREVEVGPQLEGERLIRGLPEGTRVVANGAFFLASEMAKSGFDVHAH